MNKMFVGITRDINQPPRTPLKYTTYFYQIISTERYILHMKVLLECCYINGKFTTETNDPILCYDGLDKFGSWAVFSCHVWKKTKIAL
jgi:hypothetical protein